MNVKESILTELGKQARRDYYKEWRRKNPDKVRASNERYWRKKAASKMNHSTIEMEKVRND